MTTTLFRLFFLATLGLLAACGPAATPTPAPEAVNVYSEPETAAWLNDLYTCASEQSVTVRQVALPEQADIRLAVSQSAGESDFAYQLGTEDILVVNNPLAGVGALTIEQVRALFTGQAANWKDVGGNDQPVEVWVFAPENAIQMQFAEQVLDGQRITSQARLAVSPQAMSDAVGAGAGSVGVLTRHWQAGNTREALLVAEIPVLAITSSEPEGQIKSLLTCIQK